ncbi:MAG: hypothetical protein ACFB4J_03450 [Elainellaceae cyanobacterium]
MDTIASLVQRFSRWARVTLTIFAAATLLLTTACGATAADAADSPLSAESSGTAAENTSGGQLETPEQTFEGGMNRYSDVDPRRDMSGVDAKAERLERSAQRNVEKVQDVDDFVENYKAGTPLGDRIQNIGKNVGEAAEETADDVQAGLAPEKRLRSLAGQNAENILDDTVEPAKRAAQDAKASAQRAGREAAQNTRRAARDAADAVDDAMADNAVDSAQSAGRNAVQGAQRTAKDAADAVGDAVKNATKSVKRGADDAADAVTR